MSEEREGVREGMTECILGGDCSKQQKAQRGEVMTWLDLWHSTREHMRNTGAIRIAAALANARGGVADDASTWIDMF